MQAMGSLKVAHVIDSGGLYGAEHMLLTLCREQQVSGLEVCVLSIGKLNESEKPIERALKENNVEVIPWRMKPLPDPREAMRIVRYLVAHRVDVIHSHGYKGNILFGMLPKWLRKLPCITTMHGFTRHPFFNRMTIYQWLDVFFSARLERRVLVSPIMATYLPLSKTTCVIENGLPPLAVNEQGASAAKSFTSIFQPQDFKIGSLGRLCEEKNFKLLIGAMPEILSAIPHAKLAIYGEGVLRAELTSLIQQLGLQEKVFLPGYLTETQAFFSLLDVFVNCSTTEGMPISIIEAKRQGTHLVATKIPANEHLLSHLNRLDQLCDLTEQSLAQSVIKLYKADQNQRDQLSAEYLADFQSKHLASLMAQKYRDIYLSITARSKIKNTV